MKTLILILLTVSLFTACDKNTPANSIAISPTDAIPVAVNKFTAGNAKDLLVSGKFKFGRIFTNMKEEIIPACALDDRFEFLANGNYVYTVNQLCNNDQKDDAGTWELKQLNGKTFLSTNSNNEDDEQEIIRVDADGFTITEVTDGERFTASLVLAK